MDKVEMTQEEKQLLLKKDIYARLPYGKVICGTKSSNYEPTFYATIGNSTYLLRYIEHDELKPYLRSMSSMTEEEKEEYEMLQVYPGFKTNHTDLTDMYDWLNEKKFDYRGLIPMDLALEAPKWMYQYVYIQENKILAFSLRA